VPNRGDLTKSREGGASLSPEKKSPRNLWKVMQYDL
jgi:hypothetical protein